MLVLFDCVGCMYAVGKSISRAAVVRYCLTNATSAPVARPLCVTEALWTTYVTPAAMRALSVQQVLAAADERRYLDYFSWKNQYLDAAD